MEYWNTLIGFIKAMRKQSFFKDVDDSVFAFVTIDVVAFDCDDGDDFFDLDKRNTMTKKKPDSEITLFTLKSKHKTSFTPPPPPPSAAPCNYAFGTAPQYNTSYSSWMG